jgi:hypothetical protein
MQSVCERHCFVWHAPVHALVERHVSNSFPNSWRLLRSSSTRPVPQKVRASRLLLWPLADPGSVFAPARLRPARLLGSQLDAWRVLGAAAAPLCQLQPLHCHSAAASGPSTSGRTSYDRPHIDRLLPRQPRRLHGDAAAAADASAAPSMTTRGGGIGAQLQRIVKVLREACRVHQSRAQCLCTGPSPKPTHLPCRSPILFRAL